ncbi:glycosyltransferase family 4 protein [Alteraurantiacibacter aquimixticola]|uniref:Glycosyltransferase n=1 Tax=Alteraurantiacibacter aquimixticola TaxID=2489173 RepID=A0A4T3F8B0_9SPHN|nr:glycosyltransferase family 4 protein [Alteraurantiacibacter aquimixticola]TIX51250.1 glycosyltransferase [Alteraurantiacibacter aquimixticola]
MKILFVSHAVPDVNGRGSERRAAQHLATLETLGEVTLVLPDSIAATAEGRGDAMSRLKVDRLVRRPDLTNAAIWNKRHENASGRISRAWAALHRRPEIDQAAPGRYHEECRALIDDDFDLIFAFRIASATWLDSFMPANSDSKAVRIVDFDDIESIGMTRNLPALRSSLFWQVMLRRWIKFTRQTEQRLCDSWDRVLVCSDHDIGEIRDRYGAKAIAVPNTVPFDRAESEPAPLPFRVLFVGTLSYGPNVAGIDWFVKEVWPSLHEALGSKIELVITGYDAPPEIMAFGEMDGVTVISPAESLTPLYAASHAVIAPILSGAGTRIKIIEAMAFGKAVVTTAVGCEGLAVENGEHLLIADEPKDFADAVLSLADDAALRRLVARRGREFGRDHFAPEAADEKLRAAIMAELGTASGGADARLCA